MDGKSLTGALIMLAVVVIGVLVANWVGKAIEKKA